MGRVMGQAMSQVRRVAAVACLGLGVAGCGMPSWMPSWDLSFPSAPPPASTIQLESEPAGADAKSSVGPGCRTPCSLTVATANPFTVTFSLTGYEPQTVPVAPRPGGDPRDGQALKFDPDPVYAQLEPIQAPGKGKKKAPPKKTSTLPPPPQ
jgi:hypothetical protein